MNISVQIAKIANAKGCPPYHIDYLKKDEMADIAERVVPEIVRLQKANKQLLEACKPSYKWINEICDYFGITDSESEHIRELLKAAVNAAEGEA